MPTSMLQGIEDKRTSAASAMACETADQKAAGLGKAIEAASKSEKELDRNAALQREQEEVVKKLAVSHQSIRAMLINLVSCVITQP